jgi:hypothetical protein
MKFALCAFTALTLVASPAAFAQQPALVVGEPAPSSQHVLKEGTDVRLATITELSSRKSRVGERFDLEVTDAVSLNGQVVIPAGSRAVGEITRVTKKGMWGKSGKIDTRLLYVKVGDRQIRITGASDDKGKAGTAGVVAAVVFVPVVGFFVTGTSAVIPPRTPVTAYLEEDLPVVFAAPVAPTPLVVTPVAAPAAVQAPATVQTVAQQQ